MRDNGPALTTAQGEEITVGTLVRAGSDKGVVRRTEPEYGVMTIVIEERNAKRERMVRLADIEVLPPEAVPETVPAAAGHEVHAAAHAGGDRMYFATWVWLLIITVLEVGVALLNIPRVLLVTTLIVMSFFKAFLIMATFMHLRFERLQFIYAVVVPLFFGFILFFALVPDAVNTLSREPVRAAGPIEAPAPAPGPVGPPAPPSGPPAPGGPPVAGTTVTILGKDNFFEPDSVALAASQAYKFVFKNVGTTVHNLVIQNTGAQDIASDIAVNAGDESTFNVKIDRTGSYTMQCTYHPEMTGTVAVR